ncbi:MULTISPECIES: MetQ/NlpA family ABC transporter substrate-binding protein [Aneurinibacillus]|jgi:D-methionine transport system substrate-binding protein|uniref:Lipoprotein n=1 Tax=Aneurinibacillus thermoaerophilus TaxID=143495 RepID=A0A1G7WNF2_ANETH|nr:MULTISPECIES: MetQ/NlpA family ABC transporter substrate-binding protein [Aneurinibacillus]AMA74042.1 metal ABC transporter substrate-binding protein [Aneurinibacillus sp. XH2]MED0675847.1 MetQ/NlpA family ABC transporter substrate-binding protein [Aneurinibacillus thermoaerophilus]MED0678193.1 MetQ/NlpA family ABC transporter substrate-binding protein [Aneurinibacillus thermoaerophilus]MED0737910.1 MetQ/NlpA family ABC transporter substrate-binding protein [Aneurinibacillus thermoaerophilus
MKKWIVSVVLLLTVGLLAACGGEGNGKKIVVGASSVPHAEILKFVQDKLKEQGVEMEVKEFTDYVLPNTALEEKQLDANYFQTIPYLEDFNKKHGTHIKALDGIHLEPMGLYPGKEKAPEPKQGAVVAIPDDVSNGARALKLLESKGWIKLTPGKELNSLTKQDIIQNPKKIKITEMQASMLPRAINEVDYAVINGNYAMEGGLTFDQALAVENKDSEAAKTFANIIAVREGDENREEIKKLIQVLKSDDVKKFIEEKYKGAVIPVF